MDIALLKQVRAHDNPFEYGSDVMEKVAAELSAQDSRFKGLKKKSVRDRMLRLLEQHRHKDAWQRRQSGTDEQFTEKDQLLTELEQLFKEREVHQEAKAKEKASAAEAEAAERSLALQMRADACVTLAEKKAGCSEKDAPAKKVPAASKPPTATETVVDYLREKTESDLEMKREMFT